MNENTKFVDLDIVFYDKKGKMYNASKELKEALKQTIFKNWFGD
jgi:hypothetical protein